MSHYPALLVSFLAGILFSNGSPLPEIQLPSMGSEPPSEHKYPELLSCITTLEQMTNLTSPRSRAFLSFSGHELNTLGNYDECELVEDMNYIFVRLFNKTTSTPLGLSIGACLPFECNHTAVQQYNEF